MLAFDSVRQYFAAVLVVPGLLSGCISPEVSPPATAGAPLVTVGASADPAFVTVLSFNMESRRMYFDDDGDPATSHDWTTDETLRFLAHAIAGVRPDVVVLNEVDFETVRVDGVRVPERLAIELETFTGVRWYSTFGRTCWAHGGQYGNAILSTEPIRNARSVGLVGAGDPDSFSACVQPGGHDCSIDPAPIVTTADFEQKGALLAETHGLLVVGTHLTPGGCIPDVRDTQMDRIAASLPNGFSDPVVVAGDFNEEMGYLVGAAPFMQRNFAAGEMVDATSQVDGTSLVNGLDLDHILVSGHQPLEIDGTSGLPISGVMEPYFWTIQLSDHRGVHTRLPRVWTAAVPLAVESADLPRSSLTQHLLLYSETGGAVGRGRGAIYGLGPDFRPRNSSFDWRSTWHSIVAGDFDGDGLRNDLLFYDQLNGDGVFYHVGSDTQAYQLSEIASSTLWRTTWDHVVGVDVPGGSGPHTDLLFYDSTGGDPGRGRGEIWRVSAPTSRSLIASSDNWRPSWHAIVAGDFDGDGVPSELAFYDRGNGGELVFYRVASSGSLAQIGARSGVGASWDRMVALNLSASARTDLLFYDADGGDPGRGRGQIYRTDGASSGSVVATPIADHRTWSPGWTVIAAGDFEDNGWENNLFFFNQASGAWRVYRVASNGSLHDITPS